MRQWTRLPSRERDDIEAYEIYRERYIDALIEQFQRRRPKATGPDDGMTSSFTPEVAAILFSLKA